MTDIDDTVSAGRPVDNRLDGLAAIHDQEIPQVTWAPAFHKGTQRPAGIDATKAACRGADPALWYPTRGDDDPEAKAVCAGCPVREACLEYALSAKEEFGIWGGLTAFERQQLRFPSRKRWAS